MSAQRWGRQHPQAGSECLVDHCYLVCKGGEKQAYVQPRCSDSTSRSGTKMRVCAQESDSAGQRPGEWRKLKEEENLGPVCRVQVLFDVPVRQPETKPRGKLGHPALSSKLRKTVFLFSALDWTERFRGPSSYLQETETKCLRNHLARRANFSFISPSAQFPRMKYHCIKRPSSVGPYTPCPASSPPGEPHLLEEATEVPLGARQGCHNQ